MAPNKAHFLQPNMVDISYLRKQVYVVGTKKKLLSEAFIMGTHTGEIYYTSRKHTVLPI